MKKRLLSLLLALCLVLAFASACRQADIPSEPDDTRESATQNGTPEPTVSSNQPVEGSKLASSLKEQFADNENYIYMEPLYNVPRNAQFLLKGEVFKQKDWVQNTAINDVVRVYTNSKFDNKDVYSLYIDYEIDLGTGEMTVFPWNEAFDFWSASRNVSWADMLLADLAKESDKDSESNNWGNAAKYYLIQYVDLNTGIMLEKPLVTLFTIKAELDAPQVKYSVDDEGRGVFSWEPVSEAEQYIIGNVTVVDGEPGSSRFEMIDVVEGTEWRKFGDRVTTNLEEMWTRRGDEPDWYLDAAARQNYKDYFLDTEPEFQLHKNDGICVFAVKEGGNSSMSNIISHNNLSPFTPYRPDESELRYQPSDDGSLVLKISSDIIIVPNVESAPLYQSVEMMDGSIKQFLIEYPTDAEGVDTYVANTGREWDRIIARTHGTLFKNGIVISNTGGRTLEEVLRYLKDREREAAKGGGIVDHNNMAIDDTPSVHTDDEEYEEVVEIGGDDPLDVTGEPLPDEIVLYEVYANSALSAYIATCLLNRIEAIPLNEFPEAADGSVVENAFFEAYFQNNAYIGGVQWPLIDYVLKTRTLYVEYVMSFEEQKSLQQEIDAKADEIIAQIIDPDMSDYKKQEAINNYLCANAEYDWDAIDAMNAMPRNHAIALESKYSQTAYGILINNLGICQSYAEAFNVLALKAGLGSVVVVGVLNGMGGHAWNRVMINDEWFTLDVTNNDNDLYFNEFFNMPDELAAYFVTEWGIHLIDAVLLEYTSTSYGYDYYSQNGMSTDINGLEDYLVENLRKGGSFAVVLTDILYAKPEDLFEALQNATAKTGVEYEVMLVLWVLRIEV